VSDRVATNMIQLAGSAHRHSRVSSVLVGRERELEQAVALLEKPGVKRLLILGPEGVGKQTVTQAIVRELSTTRHAEDEAALIFHDLSVSRLNNDTVATDEALEALLKEITASPSHLLYLEEFSSAFDPHKGGHTLRRLRRALNDGDVGFVATLRPDEYQTLCEQNIPAVASAATLCLRPCSENEALRILRDEAASLERAHGVGISSGAIRAAVELTERYMTTQALPGKALDALARATLRYVRKRDAKQSENPLLQDSASMQYLGAKVSFHDVKRVVGEGASVDIDADRAAAWTQATRDRLRASVFGQDSAVQRLAAAMAGIRVRFGRAGRPGGLIVVAGPRGVGKSHAIEMLSELMLQSEEDCITFDMQCFRSPADLQRLFGISSADGERGSAAVTVRKAIADKTFSFLVFKNMHVAPEEAFEIFRTIARQGFLRDRSGQKIYYKRCVLFLVFDTEYVPVLEDEPGDTLERYARDLVPLELATVMDAFVSFQQLSVEARMAIIRQQIEAFQRELMRPRPHLRVDKRVLAFLANGRDNDSTAASLVRGVETQLFAPIRQLSQTTGGKGKVTIVARADKEGIAFSVEP